MGKTGAERLRESLERKKQMKKEKNARFYLKNKDKILEERKEQRRRKRPCNNKEEQISGSEVSKPNWLFTRHVREQEREKNKRRHQRVFLFHLTLFVERFPTEHCENELLTPRKTVFHAAREKK